MFLHSLPPSLSLSLSLQRVLKRSRSLRYTFSRSITARSEFVVRKRVPASTVRSRFRDSVAIDLRHARAFLSGHQYLRKCDVNATIGVTPRVRVSTSEPRFIGNLAFKKRETVAERLLTISNFTFEPNCERIFRTLRDLWSRKEQEGKANVRHTRDQREDRRTSLRLLVLLCR